MLGAIDAVVIPSRYEPFGLIQLEAMALGALPVASRVGGLRDVIVDLREPQGFGRLVEAGDAAALAGALGELAALVRSCSEGIAAHPELDELRRRGRARALRSSARAMAEGYQALYLDLIARSSPRTRHVG
jgi:glycogen synthase